MGGEHGTPVFYLTSVGFQRAWKPLIILHDENFSCFTLLVMTLSSTSYRERSLRILQAPLFDAPASPLSLVCTLLFCPGKDSFSTFACDLPIPDPTGPDSHLLGSEPHPIRDPWPTSLHLHQPMKKEAVCIFPTATPLSFPILCLWHFPSGWHPWIDSCRTRNGGHKRHPGVVRREQRMGGGGWEEIFSFYALVRF